MKKPKDIVVSKFDNFLMPKEITNISLFDELRNIKNGEYKTIIAKCREAYAAGNVNSYNNLKTTLPSVTFSGIFNNIRKSANLIFYNNILVIDIDKLNSGDINNIKEILKADDYILSIWISPSGRGLKGLIKIQGSPQDHKISFKKIVDYYKSKYNIDIDRSGSDITRLCFTSWDKDIHYNENAKVFEYIETSILSTPKKNESNFVSSVFIKSDNTRNVNIIEDILSYLEKNKVSITKEYLNWRNVALAISSTFNEERGTNYFLRFCQLDGKLHDEEKSKALIKNIYKNTTHSGARITFKTITYLAEQKGYKKSLRSLL